MILPLRIAVVVALSYTISIAAMVPVVFVGLAAHRPMPSRRRFAAAVGWGAVVVVAFAFAARATS